MGKSQFLPPEETAPTISRRGGSSPTSTRGATVSSKTSTSRSDNNTSGGGFAVLPDVAPGTGQNIALSGLTGAEFYLRAGQTVATATTTKVQLSAVGAARFGESVFSVDASNYRINILKESELLIANVKLGLTFSATTDYVEIKLVFYNSSGAMVASYISRTKPHTTTSLDIQDVETFMIPKYAVSSNAKVLNAGGYVEMYIRQVSGSNATVVAGTSIYMLGVG